MGNIEFAERVVAKFRQRFGEDLAELQQQLSNANPDAVARIAHRMKGSSANVSAAGMRELSAVIEQLARSHRTHEIPPRLNELRRQWSQFVGLADSLSGPAAGAAPAGDRLSQGAHLY